MSVGAGILWSTIVVVAFASIWLISKAKKWRLIGKIFLGLVVLGSVVGGAVWLWFQYQERPQVVRVLDGVELGMSPLEVKLAKGEPKSSDQEDPDVQGMSFSRSSGTTTIIFRREGSESLSASIICSSSYLDEIFGLGVYDKEVEIQEKLGEPARTSIRDNGLAKMISYPQWNVAFEIEKGTVTTVCISSTGVVTFVNEHEDS